MKRSVKIGLAALLAIILLIVLPLVIASLVYSPEYVNDACSGESLASMTSRILLIERCRPAPSLFSSGMERQKMRIAFVLCFNPF